MTQISELAYFLNSIKDTLPFEDEKDFRKKIDESKDFRIRAKNWYTCQNISAGTTITSLTSIKMDRIPVS